jgi:16S rRNA (uracil1498-N3)-methyltransferase
MHNAFVSPDEWSPSTMQLQGDEARHLVSSVRARQGEEVTLFDGKGRSALCSIAAIDGKGKNMSVHCKVDSVLPERQPSTRLTLLQALPKGSRMDTLVEKVTELGAWELMPLKTERVEKQPGSKGYSGQKERWERIALSAAKQCGSPWLPSIRDVQSLSEGLAASRDADLMLVGVIGENAQPLAECLRDFGPNASSVTLVTGPEGDLTAGEIEEIVAAGARPVSFGSLVLRVETAAIYATSVLKNHFSWDLWE